MDRQTLFIYHYEIGDKYYILIIMTSPLIITTIKSNHNLQII